MIKIAVPGCSGRMGREIVSSIMADSETDTGGGTETSGHPSIGQELLTMTGNGIGGPKIVGSLEEIIGGLDAIIDFTVPEATMKHFDIAADNGKIIVIGTTGLTEENYKHIHSRSKDVRCVIAPNMSVGVNLMFKLVAEAAKIIGNEYDMEILDIHHNLKKDSPSGTAVRLADICAENTGRDISKVGVYGRHGLTGERTKDEIGIMTFRAGDVVGEHTVMFAGPGERVEITHKAGSRKNFANGAVRAVKWVAKQKHGIYDMQDVLGLK